MSSIHNNRREALKGMALGTVGLVATGTNLSAKTAAGWSLAKNELKGKVAIVTGARANLGKGFAIALAEAGADVVVHHHLPPTQDQAEETAKLCQKHGAKTAIAVGDLGQADNVKKLFDIAENQLGGVDIVVHSAGAIEKAPIAEITDEQFERVMNINFRGTFLVLREAAKRIRDEGRIINISSSITAGQTPNYGVYAGSKAGLEQMAMALSNELGPRRITVNNVAPGPLDNSFFHGEENPQSVEYATNMAPLKRLGKEDDIVPVVAMLATSQALWLNGQTIYVNNGYAS
ncbi:SDR family oxidoreductase [Tunicatimonas pelagia]|uniref:SDR family oxidoreductase n=1 Tax=Tunicatimonas pelagia TaxID=931531 RepID=UPI002665A2D0|nr:SDR family oxidoreductase [Tunicatimonas pelagia]WKN44832.1 SDR family oxidoreductase [Tunicatimonas pelagia]